MYKLTPAMQQYVDIKKQYQDCILFFRLGDFYEVFFEDAKLCHNLLDLVLTSKNKNSDNPIPMAGIPYHSVDKYITKLINLGYKIAIAEQTTLPKPGQIVQREVKKIITPGTYFEENDKNNTYIFAITSQILGGNNVYNCVWGDFSLGEYHTASFKNLQDLQKKILTISPLEIVLDVDFTDKDKIHNIVQTYLKCLVSVYDIPHNPVQRLKNICNFQNISSFGQALQDGRENAFGLLLHYLYDTQQIKNIQITQLKFHNEKDFVLIDETTIKNLEIFKSSYENNEKYSLFGVINNTATSSGSRLLQNWLLHPLKNIKNIKKRLFFINYWYNNNIQAEKFHYILKQTSDIVKIISSILYKKPFPILFAKLRKTLDILYNNGELMESIEYIKKGGFIEDNIIAKDETIQQENLIGSQHGQEGQPNLHNYKKNIKKSLFFLQSVFVDDEQINNETGFVKPGFDDEIDKLTKIAFHSDDLLIKYQQELVQKTGITNIKLKFIKNQGYFLEITNKDIGLFESFISENNEKFDFQRRQTLKGNQRYITTYLSNIEQKILQAKEDLIKREQQILNQSVSFLLENFEILSDFANIISQLDIFVSQSILARSKNYVQPTFIKKGFKIISGRHPVIEKFLPIDQQFVPNDLEISKKTSKKDFLGEIQIITGPNMGGKSTFLRQNALIVLMAHCGLFCPAKKVELQIVDGIFARVGSGDIIAKNQSTFMTEMIEVSNILHNATDKSFVIFDELGRGTSTYDGLALTRAILEYIATNLQCNTLVATHYHELIELEKKYQNIKNYSVSVYETDKDVVFLKKIVPGGADKSYGIDVAKLAGIPKPVLDKARGILNELQKQSKNNIFSTNENNQSENLLFIPQKVSSNNKNYEKIISLIKSYDLNNITPIQALNILIKLKDEL